MQKYKIIFHFANFSTIQKELTIYLILIIKLITFYESKFYYFCQSILKLEICLKTIHAHFGLPTQ